MGQQPNLEFTEAERPRQSLQPGPAVRWRADKPGIPRGPAEVPQGGTFGVVGPDPGWATKLVMAAVLPDPDSALRSMLTGLVMARTATLGRAAVPEDIEAALMICGYYDDAPAEVVEQRRRWLAAVPHETRPGETAVAEVDRALLAEGPERIRWARRHGERPGAT
ncbi:MAG: hypothetical protein L0Z49_08100 [Actinobacteria bacterium]|nr:hypothetical protein [Actinomycetota bacterium]MCI0679067.1 hypothetical protein [Actinomycetota bacterium]